MQIKIGKVKRKHYDDTKNQIIIFLLKTRYLLFMYKVKTNL